MPLPGLGLSAVARPVSALWQGRAAPLPDVGRRTSQRRGSFPEEGQRTFPRLRVSGPSHASWLPSTACLAHGLLPDARVTPARGRRPTAAPALESPYERWTPARRLGERLEVVGVVPPAPKPPQSHPRRP